MRSAFIAELTLAAEKNERIALVVGDLGYGVVEQFAARFPARFVNAGVAEQNMMGLAAGMASEGLHVFVYSIANFPTFRCAEQIRNDVDYHRLPVTIVTVGGGLAYGPLGYSHHAIQDYALLRTMPNMQIAAPGDPVEVRACVRYLTSNPQPSYLRLGKSGEPNVHVEAPAVSPGEWVPVIAAPGARKAYVTTGAALARVHELFAAGKIAGADLYTLPLWSMRSKVSQPSQCGRYETIVTVEDHLRDAGFGSWMSEALDAVDRSTCRLVCKALDAEVCGVVGDQASLYDAYGLGEAALCA